MHARTYSPTLGRFLQPDPAAAEGNLYAYAGNSPVTKADPSGRFWYRVRRGDSLEGLSRRFWGNANHVRAIVAANVGRIPQRRSTIRPGQCLNIPGYFGPRGLAMWQDASCLPKSTRGGLNLLPCNPQKFVGGAALMLFGTADTLLAFWEEFASAGTLSPIVWWQVSSGMLTMSAGSVLMMESNDCRARIH